MENGKEAPDFPAKKAQNGAKYPVFCPFFQSPMLIPLDLRNGARRVLSKIGRLRFCKWQKIK
jgi:hypothetical protein